MTDNHLGRVGKLFGKRVVKLSVPGKVGGFQHIAVTFADGNTVEVKSRTIKGAWRALAAAACRAFPTQMESDKG